MRYQQRTLMIVLVLIALFGLTLSVALAQDPEQGQTVWTEEELCRRCHGDAAEGGWAGSLAGTDVTLEELTEQVRNGGRAMPAFSEDKVSDEQLADIHAYLTSLEVVNTPTRNSFELADDAHPGQALIVQNRCIACHGPTGPVGNFNRRAEAPTAAAVIRQLRTPRMNMPMFRQDQVSDEEAATIAEFLLSQYEPAIQPIPTPLEQALAEVGGAEALQAMVTISGQSRGAMLGEDDETMQPFTSTVAYDVAGGNLRLDYYPAADAELPQMTEVIVGDEGYMMGEDETELTAEETAQALMQQRLLNPHLILSDLAANPDRAGDGGEEILDGSVYHVVTVADEAVPVMIYVSAASGRIAKVVATLEDDSTVEAFYYNWQPVGHDLFFPAELYLAIDGNIVYKEIRTALRVNQELDSALFETP